MIDTPRGDILITLTKDGKFMVYNACAMKLSFVPREIVISFLENIYLSKEIETIDIIKDNKEAE